MLLNLMPWTGVCWIGGDLGYTNDPTEIVVFQEIELPERRIVKMILRVRMEHVAYPHVAQTIALLDRYYTAAGIGVDNGGNQTYCHHLNLDFASDQTDRCVPFTRFDFIPYSVRFVLRESVMMPRWR